ncbi:MAG: ABC transporter permease, partial [Clostridiales bacterium]|nr:ABC transporter permease [Clostridiales bacterium]
MLKYFAKRLAYSAISLLVIITAVFLLMRLMPVEGYFGNRSDAMNPKVKESVLSNLGLLDPWYVQLGNFYKKTFVEGDLGRSIVLRPKTRITSILAEKIPYSAAFGLGSIALSVFLGCGLGVLMAYAKGKFWDK